MEQSLTAIPEFEGVREDARSVDLLKLIKCICYNYQPHKYPPHVVWGSLDELSRMFQTMYISESEHYDSVKTIAEVCNAIIVNFALMCTHTIDMAMKTLHSEGYIEVGVPCRKYKDGSYFKLDEIKRALIDEKAKEINISIRLLSLVLKKLFFASKQELRNDLVKGKDNYPRTVLAVLKFLQFHSL